MIGVMIVLAFVLLKCAYSAGVLACSLQVMRLLDTPPSLDSDLNLW